MYGCCVFCNVISKGFGSINRRSSFNSIIRETATKKRRERREGKLIRTGRTQTNFNEVTLLSATSTTQRLHQLHFTSHIRIDEQDFLMIDSSLTPLLNCFLDIGCNSNDGGGSKV